MVEDEPRKFEVNKSFHSFVMFLLFFFSSVLLSWISFWAYNLQVPSYAEFNEL